MTHAARKENSRKNHVLEDVQQEWTVGREIFLVWIEFELRRPSDTSPRDAGKDREIPGPSG